MRGALVLTLALACSEPIPEAWTLEEGTQAFQGCAGDQPDPGSVSAALVVDADRASLELGGCLWGLVGDGERFTAPIPQWCALVAGESASLVELLELEAAVDPDSLTVERLHRITFPSGVQCEVATDYRFTPL